MTCRCRHWVYNGELVVDCTDCDYHEPAPGYVDPRPTTTHTDAPSDSPVYHAPTTDEGDQTRI